jgi:hypothetical protein
MPIGNRVHTHADDRMMRSTRRPSPGAICLFAALPVKYERAHRLPCTYY